MIGKKTVKVPKARVTNVSWVYIQPSNYNDPSKLSAFYKQDNFRLLWSPRKIHPGPTYSRPLVYCFRPSRI